MKASAQGAAFSALFQYYPACQYVRYVTLNILSDSLSSFSFSLSSPEDTVRPFISRRVKCLLPPSLFLSSSLLAPPCLFSVFCFSFFVFWSLLEGSQTSPSGPAVSEGYSCKIMGTPVSSGCSHPALGLPTDTDSALCVCLSLSLSVCVCVCV